MTLTHTRNNELADSATDNPAHEGLTPFGRAVVTEMNVWGCCWIFRTFPRTPCDRRSPEPGAGDFSHSGAQAIVEHPRNVPDDVLKLIAEHDGVVMMNFYPGYTSDEFNRWNADVAAETARYNSPPYDGLYIGQPAQAADALALWKQQHPQPVVTIAQVGRPHRPRRQGRGNRSRRHRLGL